MDKSDKIHKIAINRGFFYPTAEIYNGPAGFWTYGHLGTTIKKRFENLWRDYFLSLNDNYFEIEGSYILPKKVFKNSGHLDHFNDPLTQCKNCKFRFRADELIEDKTNLNVEGLSDKKLNSLIKKYKLKCPKCGNKELSKVSKLNMMFKLELGTVDREEAYLSPETAQNPYLSFKRQFFSLRQKLPLGLAMIGKAFRNEISPRQGFFRLKEFNQAELQIFHDPNEVEDKVTWSKVKNYKLRLMLVKNRKQNKIVELKCEEVHKKLNLPKFYVFHLAMIQKFYLELLEIPKNKFRFHEKSKEERAFYNKIHFDMEIDFETLNGFKEVGGLHFRGDYDLTQHNKGGNDDLRVFYNDKKFLPEVLELSFGIDRTIWALLDIFYKEEKGRNLFKFPRNLAPFDAVVLPLLSNNKSIEKKSREVYDLIKNNFKIFYDDSGSIGRRYRRADEAGYPSAITIDHDSLKKNDVTIRDRDTMKQVRIKIKDLNKVLSDFLNGEDLKKLGKIIK